MLMKTVFLLALASAAYADGVRQQSGPMGRSGGGSHSPSPGSHSRNVMVIDGQYSALPVAAVESRWFPVAPDPVVLDFGDVEDGGVVTGPPQPMEAATPEPGSWVLVIGGLVVMGRKSGR